MTDEELQLLKYQDQGKVGFGRRVVNGLANPNASQGGRLNIGEFIRGFTNSGSTDLENQRQIMRQLAQEQFAKSQLSQGQARSEQRLTPAKELLTSQQLGNDQTGQRDISAANDLMSQQGVNPVFTSMSQKLQAGNLDNTNKALQGRDVISAIGERGLRNQREERAQNTNERQVGILEQSRKDAAEQAAKNHQMNAWLELEKLKALNPVQGDPNNPQTAALYARTVQQHKNYDAIGQHFGLPMVEQAVPQPSRDQSIQSLIDSRMKGNPNQFQFEPTPQAPSDILPFHKLATPEQGGFVGLTETPTEKRGPTTGQGPMTKQKYQAPSEVPNLNYSVNQRNTPLDIGTPEAPRTLGTNAIREKVMEMLKQNPPQTLDEVQRMIESLQNAVPQDKRNFEDTKSGNRRKR